MSVVSATPGTRWGVTSFLVVVAGISVVDISAVDLGVAAVADVCKVKTSFVVTGRWGISFAEVTTWTVVPVAFVVGV